MISAWGRRTGTEQSCPQRDQTTHRAPVPGSYERLDRQSGSRGEAEEPDQGHAGKRGFLCLPVRLPIGTASVHVTACARGGSSCRSGIGGEASPERGEGRTRQFDLKQHPLQPLTQEENGRASAPCPRPHDGARSLRHAGKEGLRSLPPINSPCQKTRMEERWEESCPQENL